MGANSRTTILSTDQFLRLLVTCFAHLALYHGFNWVKDMGWPSRSNYFFIGCVTVIGALYYPCCLRYWTGRNLNESVFCLSVQLLHAYLMAGRLLVSNSKFFISEITTSYITHLLLLSLSSTFQTTHMFCFWVASINMLLTYRSCARTRNNVWGCCSKRLFCYRGRLHVPCAQDTSDKACYDYYWILLSGWYYMERDSLSG
jgi:hypothetical protein